ncbi:CpaF family protein [Actinomadura rubrisoli]|uniref:CpaF family protein n=1 Tax=Actinomadura rubrisoli TaxID=2530368 RepID=A0A4R5AEZ5_9ACTN|nr:CpaF family protein [Actinomadura rubrisoli]TDD69424.1 CpaF family protein [Actinomadura rubrisoli]
MGLKDRLEDERLAGAAASRTGVSHWRRRLLEEVNLDELAQLGLAQRRARLEKVTGHIVGREGPVLSPAERTALIRRVVDEALGLGVLEPLLADETVTEIMVNGPDHVFVERDGRVERIDTTFASEDQLYQTIDRIVAQVNRRVDESSPMVDARLPSGERVNVIIPPLSLAGPVLTIRRFPRSYTIEELAARAGLDAPTGLLLASFVRARLNLVISGGTGTGKTTMLNALSAFIPEHERIVTIEDSAELRLRQEHVIPLESRPPNVEGNGRITIRDLVRNALRMRPDRIVVGEVRGGETLDMLQAMNTGHEGSMVTVHANSTDDAVYRLQTLASMSDVKLPFDTIRDQIASAVDAIVHLGRGPDGVRRITEVAVVAARRRDRLTLKTIMNFAALPIGPDRTVHGAFQHRPLPPALATRLFHAGEGIPPAFGVAQAGAAENAAAGNGALKAAWPAEAGEIAEVAWSAEAAWPAEADWSGGGSGDGTREVT